MDGLRRRIKETVQVLEAFKQRRAPGISRSDYMGRLKRDCGAYYGYNSFLLDQLLSLFPPPEAVELLEACETPRPVRV